MGVLYQANGQSGSGCAGCVQGSCLVHFSSSLENVTQCLDRDLGLVMVFYIKRQGKTAILSSSEVLLKRCAVPFMRHFALITSAVLVSLH